MGRTESTPGVMDSFNAYHSYKSPSSMKLGKPTLMERAQSKVNSMFEQITIPEFITDRLTKTEKFITHQNQVANNPVDYVKTSENSKLRKVFDFIVGGPIAAIAETISSAITTAIFAVISIGFMIVGAIDTAITLGKNTELLKTGLDALNETLKMINSTAVNALRIVPGFGVGLSYALRMAEGAVMAKASDAYHSVMAGKEGKGSRESTHRPRETVYVNPMFDDAMGDKRRTSSAEYSEA